MSQPPNRYPPVHLYNLPTISENRTHQTSAQSDAAHAVRQPLPNLANPLTQPYIPYTPPHAMFSSLPPFSTYTTSYAHNTQQYSFDDQAIRLHMIHLIGPKLTNAHPDSIALLVMHISSTLVRMQRSGELGPRGLQSAEELFLGIGYEDMNCYMGLMVNAPGAGAVKAVFKGDVMEMSARDAMKAECAAAELERRFMSALMRQYGEIRRVKLAQERW